jgi:hypothetical protein
VSTTASASRQCLRTPPAWCSGKAPGAVTSSRRSRPCSRR